MKTPPKSGSKALAAIDALLGELDTPVSACDLCAATELCPPCRPQRSE